MRGILGLAVAFLMAGCDQPTNLAPAPTLYRIGESFPADAVPPAYRSVDPEIMYVTDRQPDVVEGQVVGYGYGRSNSMALGRARVRFGDIDSWAALVARSAQDDTRNQPLVTEGFQELVRFPDTPIPAARVGGVLAPEPAIVAQYADDVAAMQATIAAELRRASRREVIIFVHGFNNDVQDGITTTASLWHYAGRIGVPISYSWPAGNPGLTAYFKDRESGEFSIYHFKEFLRALAAIPELDTITIVAHSRGADLVTSGLRELVIFERGAGRDPRRTLKIETLILAAPDLDFGVVQQRLAAEGTAAAVGQVNVYLNPRDGALGFAQALATGIRVGRLSPDDFSEDDWRQLGDMGNVQFIDVEAAGGNLGHAYFRDNPAVLSDIILTLRTGAAAGSATRPLDRIRGNFWQLHENYPGPRIMREILRGADRPGG
jgi:esterase/lipase superfamily enzyme